MAQGMFENVKHTTAKDTNNRLKTISFFFCHLLLADVTDLL